MARPQSGPAWGTRSLRRSGVWGVASPLGCSVTTALGVKRPPAGWSPSPSVSLLESKEIRLGWLASARITRIMWEAFVGSWGVPLISQVPQALTKFQGETSALPPHCGQPKPLPRLARPTRLPCPS